MTIKFKGIRLELQSGVSTIQGHVSTKSNCVYLDTDKVDRIILDEEDLTRMIELIKRNKTTEVNYK